jgi:hypothetical protein
MKHFSIHDDWKDDVEHAALCKVRNACKNWKYVLNKYFVKRGREAFKKYKSINKADWA